MRQGQASAVAERKAARFSCAPQLAAKAGLDFGEGDDFDISLANDRREILEIDPPIHEFGRYLGEVDGRNGRLG